MSLETLLEAAQYLEHKSEASVRGEIPEDYNVYASTMNRRRRSETRSEVKSSNGSKSSFDKEKRRVIGAGTREVHNKLEKNRRAHLKECFEILKNQLPMNDKASNLSILRCALRSIQSLKRKEKEYEATLDRLNKEKVKSLQRLNTLKKEFTTLRKHIDVEALLQNEELIPDNLTNSTSTASECGMLSDMEDTMDISPIPSPVPPKYIPKIEDTTVVVMSKTADNDAKTIAPSNGHSFSDKFCPNQEKCAVDTQSSATSKALSSKKHPSADYLRQSSDIKQERLGDGLNDASEPKVNLISSSNLHRLLVQPKDKPIYKSSSKGTRLQNSTDASLEKKSVPSISPKTEIVKSAHINDLPITVNVVHQSSVIQPSQKLKRAVAEVSSNSVTTPPTTVITPGGQKPIVMAQMLIPTTNTDAKVTVNAKPQVNQIPIRNIPGHITVLRAGGTTFTLPAQMLPAGTLQLNGSNTANVFSPTTQPTLQLVSQPQNNAVKVVQNTAVSNGNVFPQTITVMKQPTPNLTLPVVSSPSGSKLSSRNGGSNSSKHFPMSIKIPSSLTNDSKANSNLSVIPTSNPSKVTSEQSNRSVTSKSLNTTNQTSPLVTTPPFTFTKFSIKPVGTSSSSATVNKSSANIANQPQVSVMTMNSHPPGKAFTQILHQTLLQGIPSSGPNTISASTATPSKLNHISLQGLQGAVNAPHATQIVTSSATSVLPQVTRFIPQSMSISPIVAQGVTVVPQQSISSPGITQVTRVMPQATPIMSSFAQQVTTPVAQLVATPTAVIASTIGATRPAQVLTTSQSSQGKLITSHIPFQAVNQIPIVHQQYLHQTAVKPLVMVSNVLPQALNNDSKLSSNGVEKLKSRFS